MAPFARVQNMVSCTATNTIPCFVIDDLELDLRDFMTELGSRKDFKSTILSDLEDFIKEWNIWSKEKMPKLKDVGSLIRICDEIKASMKKIVQNLQTFQTEWKLFQERHSDLKDSSFKTVAEMCTSTCNKVTENMITITSIASVGRMLENI